MTEQGKKEQQSWWEYFQNYLPEIKISDDTKKTLSKIAYIGTGCLIGLGLVNVEMSAMQRSVPANIREYMEYKWITQNIPSMNGTYGPPQSQTEISDAQLERSQRVRKTINGPVIGHTRAQQYELHSEVAERFAEPVKTANLFGKWTLNDHHASDHAEWRLDKADRLLNYEEYTRQSALQAKDNPAKSTGNVDITPETIKDIAQLLMTNYQAFVNIGKKLPTNERTVDYIDLAQYLLKQGKLGWLPAETAIERMEGSLTPEIAALVHEFLIKGHWEAVARGEDSLYEEYLKSPYNKADPTFQIMTPEEAREVTIATIERGARERLYGGRTSAPRVNFKDFGITGFDIDPFEFEKVKFDKSNPANPYNHTPTLPVIKGIQPGDIRGR